MGYHFSDLMKKRDIYKCEDCGHEDNINYMDVSAATESDPNPVVTCPLCYGWCERIDDISCYRQLQ